MKKISQTNSGRSGLFALFLLFTRFADLGQGSGVIAFPHEPTDPGVAGTSVGPMTDDLDHAHLDPARRAQMQVLPTPHLHPRAFGIASLPHLIRFAVGPLVAALEAVSILATGTQLAGTA